MGGGSNHRGGHRGRMMMHPDASLSPIPDVPSADEKSDHDTPKRKQVGENQTINV